jgi:hypothetical protein
MPPDVKRLCALLLTASTLGLCACADDERSSGKSSNSSASSGGAGANGGQGGAGGAGANGGQGGVGGTADLTGTTCELAATIPGAGGGVELDGQPFEGSSANPGSCGYSGGAWFSFTASQPGCYGISSDPGNPLFHAQAVFEGTECEPLGDEVECLPQVSLKNTELYLDSGQGCLILVSAAALWQPSAGVTFMTNDPGRACQTAYDVSAETFPFQLAGQFPCDTRAAGSCAPYQVGNAGWFKYVPTITAPHTITAQTIGGCNMFCDPTIAVFEGDGCAPMGDEIVCANYPDSPSASVTVGLTQGTTYLIEFSLDEDADMAIDDLQIDITF